MASFSALSLSTSAFSILSYDFGSPQAEEIYGDSTRHSYDLYLEKEKKRKLQAKQEEIISLRLEAQENLLRKRELEALKEKQNTRQLQALIRREAEIKTELLAMLGQLREMDEQFNKRRHEDDLVALMLAFPFNSLVMH